MKNEQKIREGIRYLIKEALADELGQKAPINFDIDANDEAQMAHSQMLKTVKYASDIMTLLDDVQDLPAWVQAKLTKIADYISAVKHYMDSKTVRHVVTNISESKTPLKTRLDSELKGAISELKSITEHVEYNTAIEKTIKKLATPLKNLNEAVNEWYMVVTEEDEVDGEEEVNEGWDVKKGNWRFVSKDGYVQVFYNGQVIATGDFDRGADGYFLDVGKNKGQKFFDDHKQALDYFVKNKITKISEVNEDCGCGSVNEGVGDFSLKKVNSKRTPGEDGDDITITTYDVTYKGKKVGSIEHNDYFGGVDGKLFGKSLPDISGYGKGNSGPLENLHRFLKSNTGKKWVKNVKMESVNEAGDFAGWIAMFNGKKLEIKKGEAKDLWSAKKLAIQKLKVPKSKVGLLSVKPAVDESTKKKVDEDSNPCWDGYKQVGMKNKDGKRVPNCVPVDESVNEAIARKGTILQYRTDPSSDNQIVYYQIVDKRTSSRLSTDKVWVLKAIESHHPKVKVGSETEIHPKALKQDIKTGFFRIVDKKHMSESSEISESKNDDIIRDIATLATATVSSLTGEKNTQKIDNTVKNWVKWLEKQPKHYKDWKEAWKDYKSKNESVTEAANWVRFDIKSPKVREELMKMYDTDYGYMFSYNGRNDAGIVDVRSDLVNGFKKQHSPHVTMSK